MPSELSDTSVSLAVAIPVASGLAAAVVFLVLWVQRLHAQLLQSQAAELTRIMAWTERADARTEKVTLVAERVAAALAALTDEIRRTRLG